MDGADPSPDPVEQTRIMAYARRNYFDTRARKRISGHRGRHINRPHAIFDYPRKQVKFKRAAPSIACFGGPSLGRPIVEIPPDRLGKTAPQQNTCNDSEPQHDITSIVPRDSRGVW